MTPPGEDDTGIRTRLGRQERSLEVLDTDVEKLESRLHKLELEVAAQKGKEDGKKDNTANWVAIGSVVIALAALMVPLLTSD